MDMNPWLPAAPGRHGYMQVGFEQDLKLLLDGESQHVFVGAARWFFYCGEYRIRRVDDLTLEEWNMLPLPTKVVYAEHTLTKKLASENVTIQHVLERYEIGDLRLPCVQLECIGFDMAFYKAIVDDNVRHRRYSGPPTISLPKAGSRKKRKVGVEEVHDEDADE
ncbi:uncharacterized protein TRAVEDRAFT_129632 [Trametes versicolor FP-101664 SS1]|uniref:uncharacterized protein n=1 Tax=Trametes versicolor (strain FP-101664) TaxID=717944 RepID=UPI000462250E|nr:uncharacterized protein TRAVEDRAFT_129632 [Trametes versicolor FP-101664 SS1]EIW55791.1 hypothetical protein TRAVEDRAFT_129632 [Trametes versicolor FP-101664 SS1]